MLFRGLLILPIFSASLAWGSSLYNANLDPLAGLQVDAEPGRVEIRRDGGEPRTTGLWDSQVSHIREAVAAVPGLTIALDHEFPPYYHFNGLWGETYFGHSEGGVI